MEAVMSILDKYFPSRKIVEDYETVLLTAKAV
jgi:hypothetical protein